MAAGHTPASSSPARAQRDNNKPRRVLKLRFAVRRHGTSTTSPRGHSEGSVGERRVVVGGEEVSARLPRCGSPRPTRRGEGGGAGRGGGDGGEMSAWSSACPGGGGAAVHTCHACFKSFDRVKALYGHMRSCRGAAAAEESPALPRQEREKKPRAEKKEGKEDLLLLAKGLARTWAVTGTRGRAGGRSPGHGANESYQAKSARVAAPKRARVAEILREVTGLQIREEDLDRPWVSEIVRGAKDLMFLTAASDAVSGPVAAVDGHSEKDVAAAVPVPLAKIPEVKIPEHSSTVCNNSPVVPEIEVIVIDDDDDDETNDAVAEIDNTSSVTAAPEAAAAVPIATAPAATAAAAAAVAIAVVAPGAAYVNDNGNGVVAATGAGGAGAGQIKMFPCPRCHKVFDCFRALGGHMASHKNSERRARELQDIRDVSAALAVTLSGAGAGAVRSRANSWANGRGYHVCVKCRRMFPTGQSLGGHMRLHYAGPPLIGNPGSSPEPWPVPPLAGGFSLHGPAATAANTAAFVHGPAATGIGAYPYPAATTNLFPLVFPVPKQEEGKPPGVMAMAPPGNGGHCRLRLFGVDIVEGPKQEPME